MKLLKYKNVWQFNSAILPAIGLSFLPKLVCPACWPAYAGLMSALGLGFVDYTPYLFPLTLLFLLIALATMFFRAKQRHGYKPLFAGMVASSILLVGKFFLDSNLAMYMGLGLLVVASLWNTWPIKTNNGVMPCAACTSSKT